MRCGPRLEIFPRQKPRARPYRLPFLGGKGFKLGVVVLTSADFVANAGDVALAFHGIAVTVASFTDFSVPETRLR